MFIYSYICIFVYLPSLTHLQPTTQLLQFQGPDCFTPPSPAQCCHKLQTDLVLVLQTQSQCKYNQTYVHIFIYLHICISTQPHQPTTPLLQCQGQDCFTPLSPVPCCHKLQTDLVLVLQTQSQSKYNQTCVHIYIY